MQRTWLFLLYFIAIVGLHSCRNSEALAFNDEIQAFKKADRKHFPPRDAILFVGSSSIRKWDDISSYFPGFVVIQRGFGGSGLNDAVRYANDIIIPYHPKQIIIYSGENDIAAGNVTATDVLQRFMKLFKLIRGELPDASVVFISIKPSPSRQQLMPVMEESNIMIRQFLSAYSKTAYVDVYHLMLDREGNPRKELFLSDDLHMNRDGYIIWRDALLPVLKR